MSDLPQKSSSQPAPPTERWYDLEAAARLTGKSVGHLRRLAGDRWLSEGKARFNQAPGTKPFWEVRADVDALLVASDGSQTNVGPSIELRNYPQNLQDQAFRRKAILDRWQQALSGGMAMGLSREVATNAFVALLAKEDNKEATKRTQLYEWSAAFKSEGFVGLMDGRARRVVDEKLGTGSADPFLEEVKTLWLCQQKPGVAICHKMALLQASKMGWEPRSYRTAKRFIEKFEVDNPAIVAQLRGGDEVFKNEIARFITRDYSTLVSNEIWNADHHQFDVVVEIGRKLNPSSGEMEPILARPWLTAWQDLRSRKIVGWIIRARDPNTDAILESLRIAVHTHHVPKAVYTDNGKDFDSQVLTGETKKMRWQRRRLRVDHDQQRLGGIYAALQVRHIHAWPYHGQSKPIERFFGTLEEHFGKTFDTYTGRNAQERPEQLPDMIKRGRAPILQDFIGQFTTWLEVGYHQQIHTGDAMGERPAVVWEANLQTIRTAEAEVLDLIMQPKIGPLKVGQNGIVHKGIWYGQYELSSWFGKEVFAAPVGNSLDKMNVFADDGRFLCVAKANLRIAANATRDMLAPVIAEQRKENKTLRDAARIRPKLHMNRTDRLNDFAAMEAAQAKASQADPVPSSISIIRSDIEGQLPAIRAGHEMPLKKAVGDDTPRFRYASQEDGGGGDSGGGDTDGNSPRMGFVYHPTRGDEP